MAADSGDLGVLLKAVRSVIDDSGFGIASEKAEKAKLVAERMLRWLGDNKDESETFASCLLSNIQECCTNQTPVLCHSLKEKMWERYYKLCSSDSFRSSWSRFIETSVGLPGTPIFFMFVTKWIMEDVMKVQFLVDNVTGKSDTTVPLDFEERNELYYCGGYLIRSVKFKISKSSHPLKSSLLECLKDVLDAGESFHQSQEDDVADFDQWMETVNRGGLVFVDDRLFNLLISLELEIRNTFDSSNLQCANESLKDVVLQRVVANEDISFYWSLIAADWEEHESQELFMFIVRHYVTVRGFSFCSAFMEKYKQRAKKSTQKSKGLRKTL